jgi:uroporphyrinogen decarboxylase
MEQKVKLTSRERVLRAFQFKSSDRIPVDLSGHRSSGLSASLYPKLRTALGLKPASIRIYDPVQQLAVLDNDVLDALGIDTIELGRAFALEDGDWRPWVLPDGTDCFLPEWVNPEREEKRWVIRSASGRIIAQMPDGAQFFEQVWYPFYEEGTDRTDINAAMDESMWHTVVSPPGPLTDGREGEKLLKETAFRLRRSTDRAIIGLFGGNLLESGQMLYRNDQFLLMLAMDPPGVHDFLDRLLEIHMANLDRFLSAVGNNIDIILFGDDLGMQSGPQMSPEMYREYFKPRHQIMWARAKELADVKVMLHCCGGVRELLPDLIDAGLDTINPVQTTARGMEPEQLKQDFGKEIVFWGGGCDTQHVLPEGNPQDVYDHVHKQLEILSPDGGFVFQQIHNILPEVPIENILAMFSSVKDFQIK